MKRGIKLMVSTVYFLLGWAAFHLKRVLGGLQGGEVTVLYYHEVGDQEVDRFVHQMKMLNSLFRVVDADRCDRQLPPGKFVVLTFDDGFVKTLERIIPIIRSMRIPVTIFVPAGYVSRVADWWQGEDYRVREPEVVDGKLLKHLANDPLVTVGSHGVSHGKLSTMGDDDARKEIFHSKEILEATIGREVGTISFPYGDYLPRHVEMARLAGYTKVMTTEYETVRPAADEFKWGRFSVEPSDHPFEFLLKAWGAYSWLGWVRLAGSFFRKGRYNFARTDWGK